MQFHLIILHERWQVSFQRVGGRSGITWLVVDSRSDTILSQRYLSFYLHPLPYVLFHLRPSKLNLTLRFHLFSLDFGDCCCYCC